MSQRPKAMATGMARSIAAPLFDGLSSAGGAFGPIPRNVSVAAGYYDLTVTWNPVSGATSYNIYYAEGATVTTGDTQIAGVTSPHEISGLDVDTQYTVAVTAVVDAVESDLSTAVTRSTLDPVPQGVGVAAGDETLTVSWTAVAGATSYNIYYAAGWTVTTGDTKITGVTSPYDITGLTDNAEYTVAVTAVVDAVESDLSTPVTDTTRPWTLARLPNVFAVWDATDSDSITASAGAVLGWDSQGGAVTATPPVIAEAPSTGVQTMNSLNIVSGDDVDDVLSFHADDLDFTTEIHVFLAGTDFAKFDAVFDFVRSSDMLRILLTSGVTVRQRGGSSSVQTQTEFTGDRIIHAAYVNAGVATNDELRLWLDGSTTQWTGYPVHHAVSAHTAGETPELGYMLDDASGGNAWGGGVGEYCVVNGSVSAADEEKAVAYLAWKWGRVAQLPAGNAYKSDGSIFGF